MAKAKRLCLHCGKSISLYATPTMKVHHACKRKYKKNQRSIRESTEEFRKKNRKKQCAWRQHNKDKVRAYNRRHYGKNRSHICSARNSQAKIDRILVIVMRTIISESGKTIKEFIKDFGYAT